MKLQTDSMATRINNVLSNRIRETTHKIKKNNNLVCELAKLIGFDLYTIDSFFYFAHLVHLPNHRNKKFHGNHHQQMIE